MVSKDTGDNSDDFYPDEIDPTDLQDMFQHLDDSASQKQTEYNDTSLTKQEPDESYSDVQSGQGAEYRIGVLTEKIRQLKSEKEELEQEVEKIRGEKKELQESLQRVFRYVGEEIQNQELGTVEE